MLLLLRHKNNMNVKDLKQVLSVMPEDAEVVALPTDLFDTETHSYTDGDQLEADVVVVGGKVVILHG